VIAGVEGTLLCDATAAGVVPARTRRIWVGLHAQHAGCLHEALHLELRGRLLEHARVVRALRPRREHAQVGG
jgi:hypothetical protein